MKALIENRIAELKKEKEELHFAYLAEITEAQREQLSASSMRISMELKFLNELSQAAVSGSLGFDEGYSKGYSDAQREATQEIREHYHPNDR